MDDDEGKEHSSNKRGRSILENKIVKEPKCKAVDDDDCTVKDNMIRFNPIIPKINLSPEKRYKSIVRKQDIDQYNFNFLNKLRIHFSRKSDGKFVNTVGILKARMSNNSRIYECIANRESKTSNFSSRSVF